ncbi:hypothetical protein ASZ90_006415 [hydrocarbon metagenome]|uniref:Type 4 fimbrial biogenesis protein PilX N-terminal domain-containing protein n=1 Tax=hydrocarbon metagenome TaxID=938273 RepID=A0A0W8FSL9_9ZZZZ
MCFLRKSIKKTAESEKGFVFLVSLMAIVVLIAIGLFALTTVSEDLMISFRLTGERKAFSAAESGAYAAAANIAIYDALPSPADKDAVLYTFPKTYIDPDNDPNASYTGRVSWVRSIGTEGFSFDYNFSSDLFKTVITGKDSFYGSTVNIEVGVSDTPGRTEDTVYKH